MQHTTEPSKNVEKLAELIQGIRIAMLTTSDTDGSLHSRPMATQEAPEVVVTEMLLDGGQTGIELVECLRQDPRTRDVPVIVLTAEPNVPTVSYSPRGIGTLWERHVSPHGSALAAVVGRTRATLLSQLDLPMSTTQLATALTLSAPTLSAHLHTLRRAGIVSSRRDGRAVLYSRTPLGDDLLNGAAEPT